MDLFTDFLLATGPADIGGAQGLQNLITRNSYFLKYLVSGGPGVKMCQGGSSIRGDVMIRESSTYTSYKPGEKMSWVNPQVTEDYQCYWRFSLDHIAYTDQEVMLNNETGGQYRSDVRIQAFIDMRKKINMRGVTSLIHGMEDELWTVPNYNEMELQGGRQVQSLALFSNELPNGLYADYDATGLVQGINKNTYSSWDNARVAYDEIGSISTGKHLFEAMDEIMMDLNYDQMPAMGAEYTDPTTRPQVIVTQKQGILDFKEALRTNQDWFRHGPDDPKYGAQFDGIQLERVNALETAEIYPTAEAQDLGDETSYGLWSDTNNTNLVGPDGSTNAGARYHFLDFSTLHKITHTERFFTYLDVKKPSNQATTNIIPIDSWHNNFCRDLRRQGIVYPGIPSA